MKLNGDRLNMTNGAMVISNVQQCGTHPCHSDTCLANGECIEYHDNYLCMCPAPYHGENCQLC
jgi:hypothetical protein